MKKPIVLLLLPLSLLFACNRGDGGVSQKEALETQVLAVHDSAMARMGDVFKLRRQLRELRDTLASQQADSSAILVLQGEINSLNNADEVMMQWMRQYEAPDSLQEQQAMEYLQQELVKVERVQTIMDSTLQAAHQTAQKYEQQK